jgi:16S rRNA (uracil1498-N3)-methyltransferase
MNRKDEKNSASRPGRLFVRDVPPEPGELALDKDQAHYLRNVLRMGPGDDLVLFDGSGWEYPASISQTSSNSVKLQVSGRREGLQEPPVQLTLGLGLLKAQKMELVIQKCSELGVHRICPVSCQRAVRSMKESRSAERKKRWEKIAREASRQCGRNRVAEIRPVIALDEVGEEVRHADLALLFSTREGKPLGRIAEGVSGAPERIFALTGPEGGFSREEEERLLQAGFIPARLGPRTLRAETAAIMAVGLLQYRFGDLAD